MSNLEQKNHIEMGAGPFDSSIISLIQTQTRPSISIAFNQKDESAHQQQPYQDKIINLQMLVQNEIENHLTQFWHSRGILLSQIINYRLNLPRLNERTFHSEYVKQVAMAFEIESWQEFIEPPNLYEMSLTGHLIRAIQSSGTRTSLNTLIAMTEPFLPYLRKLNGKNFFGTVSRTVKGCLSAVVFRRQGENYWSINQEKVLEFIVQSNAKLTSFFQKLKKNFPKFDEIRVYSHSRKKGCKRAKPSTSTNEKLHRKIEMKNKELDQLIQGQMRGLNLNLMQSDIKFDQNVIYEAEKLIQQQSQLIFQQDNEQEQIKIEEQNKFSMPDPSVVEIKRQVEIMEQLKQNLLLEKDAIQIGEFGQNNWESSVNEQIQRSLSEMYNNRTEKIECKLLGILIAFNRLKPILMQNQQCKRQYD